jgi:hypothetical protein
LRGGGVLILAAAALIVSCKAAGSAAEIFGGGPSEYKITVADDVKDNVTANPVQAEAGATITVTISSTPFGSPVLASLTAEYEEGKKRLIASNGNGTFRFTMPEAAVELKAVFKASGAPWTPAPLPNPGAGDEEDYSYEVVNESSKDLSVKFGIEGSGAEKVGRTLLAVKGYLQDVSAGEAAAGKIALKDYITIPSLTVDNYNGVGYFTTSNAVVEVVGLSPYKGKNDNGSDEHIVFQFKDVLTKRRMNSTDTNAGGYAGSEMRKYLAEVSGDAASGKFYAGLIAAGVPSSTLWNPKREIGGSGSTKSTVADSVYLPTLWEVAETNNFTHSGSTGTAVTQNEGAGTQGRLKAYGAGENGNNSRKKTGTIDWWWLASASIYKSSAFCDVNTTGIAATNANSAGGVAPAFCVK